MLGVVYPLRLTGSLYIGNKMIVRHAKRRHLQAQFPCVNCESTCKETASVCAHAGMALRVIYGGCQSRTKRISSFSIVFALDRLRPKAIAWLARSQNTANL